MKKYRFWQLSNILLFAVTIVVNYLSGAGIIGGVSTGEVSARYQNLFTPEGFTFSIWGVIYAWLAVYVFYQSEDLFKKEFKTKDFVFRISGWFALSNIINICWIFVWHSFMPGLALVLLILLFFSLLILYMRLQINLADVPAKEKYLVRAPFSVYFGWVNIAVMANAAAYLTDIKWSGFGIEEANWVRILMIAAGFLAILMITLRNDTLFGIVVIWALWGIISKWHATQQPALAGLYVTGLIIMGAIAIFEIISIVRHRRFY